MYTSTELQIWRQVSPQEYVKVNGTSVYVDSENASEVYEIETSRGRHTGVFSTLQHEKSVRFVSGRFTNDYHLSQDTEKCRPDTTTAWCTVLH